MVYNRNIVYILCSTHFWLPTYASYVWPNEKIDELESLLFEQDNPVDANTLSFFVGGCHGPNEQDLGLGRSFGAEWLRNAYHDMATADVVAGTGGLDASIVFEMDRPENVGTAFQETLHFMLNHYNSRVSMADLFALATVEAVGSCSNGNIIMPFRAGRIDAVGPGPLGVPEPQQDLETHTKIFAKQGFNTSEMIALVACGHSIGGVHGVDFPEIVPNPAQPTNITDDNTVSFDTSTDNFDNQVAKEFVANTSQNPLAFGHNETTRSDFRIFNADGGDIISQMASSESFFFDICNTVLERMINTVPRNVQLTDIITPLDVKPRRLSIVINADGTLSIKGTIRIIDNLLKGDDDNGSQVHIHLISRTGEPLPVATGTLSGTGGCTYPNCGPNYRYYDFGTVVPAEQGVSSFIVKMTDTVTGKVAVYDNQGAGFPLSDAIQPVYSLSTQRTVTIDGIGHRQLNLTAAVLNAEQFVNVSLIVPQPSDKSAAISPWISETVLMKPLQKIAGTNFTLYTGIWTSNGSEAESPRNPFDLVATGPKRTVSSLFNSWAGIAGGSH